MGRLVSAGGRGARTFTGDDANDGVLGRIVKYIPAETVAVYLSLQAFFSTPEPWWYAVYALLLVLTPVYVWKVAGKGQPWKLHALIATLGFVVWSYALHSDGKFSPFFAIEYSRHFAGALIILFPFATGWIVPKAS